MTETDPGKLADHLEREADELEQHSEELEQQTEDASQDWQRKRADPSVPGAPPGGDQSAACTFLTISAKAVASS